MVERYWIDRAHLIELLVAETMPDERVLVTLRDRDVRLKLVETQVLRKRIGYPVAVEENLVEVLANDMDRQTPFAAEQVYFAYRLQGRFENAEQGPRIHVDLALLRRSTLEPLVNAVRQAGGRVCSIALDADGARFEFLREQERPPRRLTSLQKINLVLIVAMVLLLLAAAAAPAVVKRVQIAYLTPMVDKARNEAESTRKIESEYQRLLTEYQTATNRKHAAHPLIDVIEELSRLSPDTTWLKSLEMKSPGKSKDRTVREVTLTGEAASASKMIELLEQSALLQNTTQRAQTTRGSQPNTEQFQIASEVKPRVVPAPIGLESMPEKTAPVSAGATPPAVATPGPNGTVPPAVPTTSAVPSPAPTAPGKPPAPAATTGKAAEEAKR